ncbi:hypothetical protein FYA67_08800 [Bordetella holmesii]|nr:hypothetical protein H558_14835 [Bordetella holmesii H558]AMD50499.1 hypothetical protein F783_003235 [Bordetella holmesii F627]AOB35549.1 hypothetical protein BBB42_08605 [Bordetella holmesii]AUL21256.1 hypothetical protein BTL46_08610 [Bordetella holmesii]AUL22865.1 hypothetical protein BTL48_08695 [Bordetella holmesii]
MAGLVRRGASRCAHQGGEDILHLGCGAVVAQRCGPIRVDTAGLADVVVKIQGRVELGRQMGMDAIASPGPSKGGAMRSGSSRVTDRFMTEIPSRGGLCTVIPPQKR